MNTRLVKRWWQLFAVVTLAVPVVLGLGEPVEPLWESGREITAPPWLTPWWISVLAIVIGVLAVWRVWRPTKFFITLIHEFGHALTAALVGGRPVRITMKLDTSGLATTYNPPGRLRSSLVSFAGYVAPGVAALGGAAAIRAGNASWWLLITGILLTVMLIGLARSITAPIVAATLVGGIAAVLWWAPWAATGGATLLVTVWAVGGIRAAYGQLHFLDTTRCDALNIEERLRVPRRAVAICQLGVTCALTAGVIWLSVI